MQPPRVLIVDDQPEFTEGIRTCSSHTVAPSVKSTIPSAPWKWPASFVLISPSLTITCPFFRAMSSPGNSSTPSSSPASMSCFAAASRNHCSTSILPPRVRIASKPISYGKLLEWLALQPLEKVA